MATEWKDEKAAERKSEMAEKKYPIALDWFRICVGKKSYSKCPLVDPRKEALLFGGRCC
jgi:hypothetical protein